MSWVATGVTVGGSILSGIMGSSSAKKAAKAQEQASQAAIAEQRRQYDQTRTDQMPWLLAGNSALNQLQQLNSGNFESFQSSPDYAYARDQMQQGVERGAAARGGLYSGGSQVDLANAMNGIASQNYGNYYGRLAQLAGVGQSTATNLGSMGQAAASNIGNAQMAAGNARASGYTNSNNAWQSALSGISGGIGFAQGQNWGRGA